MFFERLQNFKQLKIEYETALEQLKEIKAEKDNIKAVSYTNEIKNKQYYDKISSLLVKYEKMYEHFLNINKKVLSEKEYLLATLDKVLNDNVVKSVVIYKFINCYKADVIADKLFISHKTIYRCVKKAEFLVRHLA